MASRNYILETIVVGVGVSLVTTIWNAVTARKNRKKIESVCKNLNSTIDKVANEDVEIDISETIITTAVEKKVNAEVTRMAKQAAEDAKKQVTGTFYDLISREVNAQYDSIKDEVARELRTQVGRLDINDIKKQVINKAKDEAAEKFRDGLDDILNKYSDQLDDIGRIYSSFAKKFNDNM